jgi:hypothetical protein
MLVKSGNRFQSLRWNSEEFVAQFVCYFFIASVALNKIHGFGLTIFVYACYILRMLLQQELRKEPYSTRLI